MKTTQASVDLAKSAFQVARSPTPDRVEAHRRLSRKGFQRFFQEREPTEVLMEACGTATRRTGRIWVALLEASRQQALTSLHRLRSAYGADRIRRINTVRGILREFGYALPQGSSTIVEKARIVLDDEQLPIELRAELGLTPRESWSGFKFNTEPLGRGGCHI